MTASSKTNSLSLDLLTILAIGVISFIIKNVIHEALGHGDACILVGGTPLVLSSAHFDCDYTSVSEAGRRFVAAAGTLVNFIAAYFFWLAFHSKRVMSPSLRYFFWFAMTGNFFVAAGYPLFSGVIGVGDWVNVVEGFQPAWLWRVLLAMIGFLLYGYGIWFALREMKTLIGSDSSDRRVRAFRLTFFPYLAGATVSSLGAWFNPLGAFVILTSAAAAFGGSSAYAWMSQMLDTKWFPEWSNEYVVIERSWTWIIIAAILALIHILVLGPGVGL
ncbi:MAG TPA: hypothetical protein VJ830_07170 [Anaerolineales bacterium]|nr:hypothetical protein [Anaerolineales bacterium]